MITTFFEINDLHTANKAGLEARWKDFHIIRNESVSADHVKKMPSHRCDFHHICLDLESDYKLGLDAQDQYIKSHNLYFIPKGTVLSWESDHDNLWKGYTIFFKPEFVKNYSQPSSEYLFASLKPTVFTLNQEQLTHLSGFCEQMLEEQALELKDVRNVLRDWFCLFLKYCDRYYHLTEENIHSNALKLKYQFQELLSFNIEKERSVHFYADALNISSRHFTRLIKKATGISAKQMIQNKLTDFAKERLLNSESDISQIAYNLGFTNSPQFTRVFKKATGLTPSEFRKLSKKAG
ncbi:MAG: AraC family transcriptional regulator [Bacteroidota bacterium]